MNRQLHFAQKFQNAKQNEKQIAQIFDNHLSYLKVQLHSFTEKQRRINFFIRLRFALRAALTNFQNIFDRRENLIILAIKLKINIKRHDNVITTFSDRSKSSKNVRRKFSKHKKKDDAQSADEKSKHENKKSKKKKTKSIFEIICYNCEQKEHYAIQCLNASKNDKIKTNINVVEQTKKEKFLKKKIRKSSETADE